MSRHLGRSMLLVPWFAAASAAATAPTRLYDVETARPEVAVWSQPAALSHRRGSLPAGFVFFPRDERWGGDCDGAPWLKVADGAWVCGTETSERSRASRVPSAPLAMTSHGVIGANGAFAYDAPGTADLVPPTQQLDPGTLLSFDARSTNDVGEPLLQATNGRWLPARDVTTVTASSFAGVTGADNVQRVAWVMARGTRPRATPGGAFCGDAIRWRTQVEVVEEASKGDLRWVRARDLGWLPRAALRRPTVPPPTSLLHPHERWLDLDRKQQVLVALDGATAAFATLVSTGNGSPGSATETPPGSYRIWIKLRYADMNGRDPTTERYAIHGVPWVQYFHQGFGLHGAFWHDEFGVPRSHGCVNLSPADAAFLFRWTSPSLPSGWSAIYPVTSESATLVRIR